ncbi:hypothetical protein [Clostridium sp. Marseille-Q2269]|uniref:hypothetical protein n=1 Tax=Clostridium sp. Marseille-Q2269 TaxID=2942205 RepID=UPI0020744311|nr:hypothetical protein [Clostridium sp. Marseille-Q2269]
MKRRISPLTILVGNILFSLILYVGILLPLVINSKVNMSIFPIVIVVHNIILWTLIVYFEKHIIN